MYVCVPIFLLYLCIFEAYVDKHLYVLACVAGWGGGRGRRGRVQEYTVYCSIENIINFGAAT